MPRNDSDIPDCLRSLSQEELDKIPPLTKEEIWEALRKGREEAEAARPFLLPSRGPGGGILYR